MPQTDETQEASDIKARNNVRSALNVLEDLERNVLENTEDLLFNQDDEAAAEEYVALAALRTTAHTLRTFSGYLFDEEHTIEGEWN